MSTSFFGRAKKCRIRREEWPSPSPAVPLVSLRLGHARGKTILNRFLILSRRFATLHREGSLGSHSGVAKEGFIYADLFHLIRKQ